MNSKDWLSLWLSRLSHDVEIRSLPSKDQLWSRNPDEIAARIHQMEQKRQNVFFGVLGREGKGGGKENVKEAHCLWADIDFKDLKEGQAEADGIVATFDHAPSLQIATGGGYHLYWFLEERTNDVGRVERILKGFCPRLKSDPSATDISRVLRVPGTKNFKYDPPRTVKIVSFEPDRLYSLEDFKEWELPEEPSEETLPADGDEKIDLKAYLKQYRVQLAKIKKHGDATLYCLKKCLFVQEHTTGEMTGESAIGQQPDGKLFYHCFHSHCQGKTWAEARMKISGTDPLTPFIGRDLKALIQNYVSRATGQFSIGTMTGWLEIKTMSEREVTMATLEELEKNRVIARTGNRHGVYRPVERNPRIMNLDEIEERPCAVTLPFLLHTIVDLFPKNVILVAGEKDAGKTAFALNSAYMNRNVMPVVYINSEMGLTELKKRLRKFPEEYPWSEWKKIRWIEQSSSFEDIIDPEGFNIIDFLEVGADAYAVVEDIKRVFDRLTTGLLLIVMQKRSYKEWAVGGEATLEKARLALNLEHRSGVGNLCRITVAKNWTGVVDHPKGKVCVYKTWNGGKMEMTDHWHEPQDDEARRPGRGYDFKKNTMAGVSDFVHGE
jgi:hypothetical protein